MLDDAARQQQLWLQHQQQMQQSHQAMNQHAYSTPSSAMGSGAGGAVPFVPVATYAAGCAGSTGSHAAQFQQPMVSPSGMMGGAGPPSGGQSYADFSVGQWEQHQLRMQHTQRRLQQQQQILQAQQGMKVGGAA